MNQERTPRFEYDCGHCKLNWCCGELCACFRWPEAVPTPKSRMSLVNRLQKTWRKLTRLPHSVIRAKRLEALKKKCLTSRTAWYKSHPKWKC